MHLVPDPFPPVYSVGYLNRPKVQQALGAKVNYTASTPIVEECEFSFCTMFGRLNNMTVVFPLSGDFMRGGFAEALASLIDEGVSVALMYGDRDFTCNCEQPTFQGNTLLCYADTCERDGW